jgi:hypothetical protein
LEEEETLLMDIHHKDGGPTNNDVGNLEMHEAVDERRLRSLVRDPLFGLDFPKESAELLARWRMADQAEGRARFRADVEALEDAWTRGDNVAVAGLIVRLREAVQPGVGVDLERDAVK